MTVRLYYTDAYTLEFDAHVRSLDATRTRVTLDRTAFYPTSGGQPHDTGLLEGARVIDVIDAEGDGIVHVLETPFGGGIGDAVVGAVDAARRRDHREQHTAQHLLSAIAADRFGWDTVSVHFGAERSLIEFDTDTITVAELQALERLADEAARTPYPVTVSFEEAGAALGLRKPTQRDGEIRIVSIGTLDRSACGGTHVRSTVEVLPIVLQGMERLRGHMRIAFLAGQRAVQHAAHDAALLSALGTRLTCAPVELPMAVDKLAARVDTLEAERRRLRSQLATIDARTLWEGAHLDADGVRRIVVARDEPLEESKPLVQALQALGGVLICLTSTNPLGVLLAASSDVPVECGARLRDALVAEGGRGGGNRGQAQGTVPSTDALARVVARLGFGD